MGSEDGGRRASLRPDGRWRPTVGHWLVFLTVAFFLLPLTFSNVWGYLQSRSYMSDAALRHLHNVAALQSSEILEYARSQDQLAASVVAGNEHVFRLLRLLEMHQEPQVRGALGEMMSAHLSAKAREAGSVEEFLILSRSGRPFASSQSAAPPPSDPLSSECFERALESPGILGFRPITHVAAEGRLPEPHLIVARPIHDEGGLLLGALCSTAGFDPLRRLLIANRDRTRSATFYLLDARGEVVSGSFDDPGLAPYGSRLALLDPEWQQASRAREGRVRDPSGVDWLLASAPVGDLGWSVVVRTSVLHAVAELEQLKAQAMVAIALVGLILGGAVWIGWRAVASPLRALAITSDRMASGQPGDTVEPEGPREIMELATSFNRMSLALKTAHGTLESKVSERTKELRENQEFLELLLDSIDQRVVVLDPDHRIVRCNEAARRMHGKRLVGLLSFEVFEGLTSPPADSPASATFETGMPGSGERSQRTVRGLEPVYVETYPVRDEAGQVGAVVEIGRVVTDEKRLQMQMVYQEKMAAFGQLAAGLAHEIGNPLASIESQLQMAQRHPDRLGHTVEVVGKQVERMGRMLRRLVDFSRRRRADETLVSTGQVVDDVAQLLEHDPRARRVTIERSVPEGLPGIRTKEDELAQVLMNLGINALDAIGGSGTLTFEASARDGRVEIRVQDDGHGVPASAREQLFDPFFTTKEAGRGTGLGLFVSKGIIEGMGGEICLERTGPGGTVFVIRLASEHQQRSRT